LALVACGGNDEPSHTWPPDGEAGSTSTGGTAAPGIAGNGAGTSAQTGGGAPVANGGAGNVAGANTSGGAVTSAGSSPGGAGSGAAGSSSGGAGAQSEYWLAPDGLDTNPGTEAAPLKTLAFAVKRAKPGVKFWLKPGTYASAAPVDIIFSYSGTETMPVRLQAAAGGRPVLDFTGQTVGNDEARGLNLLANYWHIKGIELKKTGDNCIAIAGSHNVIEDVITHECGDTGIQITAPSSQAADDTRAAHNLVLNCDSWGNLDSATGGENADGFAAKLRIGPGNVFRGCRAWNNADDGWDLFAADDVVVIDKSWAFSNGKPLGGSATASSWAASPTAKAKAARCTWSRTLLASRTKAAASCATTTPKLPSLPAAARREIRPHTAISLSPAKPA
jgi:hypothetical protein